LKKIHEFKDDLEAVLLLAGSAITGDSRKDQTTLFAIGEGSTGKSVFMELLCACLGKYVFELKNDTFEAGNANMDKLLNSFLIHRYIRIAWVNEFAYPN
jgi:phage/plasmid-associated DNA primase